jgi:HAMP domain-containing protein/CheY-like chemotaxis protein/signal transduction histidine kinase
MADESKAGEKSPTKTRRKSTAQKSAPEKTSGSADSNGTSNELDYRELLLVLNRVKNGDFKARLESEAGGTAGRIVDTLNAVIEQNERLEAELKRVADVVGTRGQIDQRAALPAASGGYASCIDGVNELITDLGQPIREVERVIGAVARGDLSQTMEMEIDGRPVRGEFLRTSKIVNKMVNQLGSFSSEVTRVAREVGTEGKLGGQARIQGVSGTWKDLTDNVNSMADNLTAQVRNIAEVTTAVANGDLTKKITVDAKGEILELKNTINTMVDQLGSFASEVTRVAREVGTEGKLGGQAEVRGVSGTWKDLTDNVNSMADNLTVQVRNIAEVTTAVANGDLTKEITVDAKGEILELKNTINTMVDQLGSFASEVTRVAREVGTEGELGGQADVPGVSGTWKDLTDNVNSMADNLTTQVRAIAEVTTAVANGDLSKKIAVDVKGEIAELKNTINTMVDQLGSFASEVTRVAREVGTEGKLGGQAEVRGVSGVWRDLTENVNSMADNLTTQVRAIAEVTTAVATGDLSKKIAVDVKGEILELKNTINTMVDQLSSFASEVTRVAREVGTEGELGGQADVRGVSGVWKDLTDNVNSMADNLTEQVRNIAEVTTAVANGDLTKKIAVDAKGEILELKNTINTMVEQLSAFASEVTRVAREVGTEGKLGGEADVPGVSGTWKDLTDNVNSMADNLTTQVRAIAEVTTAVANGDLSKKIAVDVKGEILELKNTINTMVDQLSSFASEVTRVAREVGTEGKLGGQAEVRGVSGVWKDLTDNVNSMADNLTEQVRNIADVTTAVATGDLTKKIEVDARGEILQLKNTINTMVEQLSAFASEVTRVAREVGTEGELGGQADVRGVSGVWKDLTDNVNSMASNLTAQVRGIATVVTAVARGNLKQKLSVEAQGEIAELADTINNMIDTLATFADQVTTVAREVGIEGKLGGQAEVPGASGTWRDLTDNVNRLAANLTTQVRAITEVTTAVAAGDLTKQITVEAAGEVGDLKNNVNEMIRNLKETTRRNTEQDWLKTNLTKFTQLLQGQKDLYTVSKLILSELAPLMKVQHGVFYIAEPAAESDGEPVLRLIASYAYKERKGLANTFRLGEGLVGQTALEKERILIHDVPGDYIKINSGLGESPPRNIVALPVIFEGQVKAIIELASFHSFTSNTLSFLDQLTESIGIVLNTIEANMRTEMLLKQSQSLTQELQSQQQELTETNQRLEHQARSLQESEDLLKRQQEELQQTNIELEEKARLLAEQKSEVENKNREIELARQAIEEKAEQLALTSKYKSEFLANMSHELRTPLNSMLILSKMLSENRDSTLTNRQVEFAETIHSSGSDLLALINEILDLSKIESGTMAVDIEDFELSKVESHMRRMFDQVAREKGLDFNIKYSGDLPDAIRSDSKRLEQVLKNLLSNAFKFTREGEVTLQIEAIEPRGQFDNQILNRARKVVAFHVVDTGVGISRDKQKIVFEAFQQADGAMNRDYGGTGLGLSISREIARLLGGEIELESQEGKGSRFTLYLPDIYRMTQLAAQSSDDHDESPQDASEASAANGRGTNVGIALGSRTVRPDKQAEAEALEQPPKKKPASGKKPTDEAAAKDNESRDEASVEPTVEDESKRMLREAAPGRAEDDRNDLEEGDRRLLIVEDDVNYARIIVEMARTKGFKVIVGTNAEEALELAREYRPDAITLDVQLPGMHGLALLDLLKNEPATRHIPVQIISVADELPRRRRKGALGQLKKPASQEKVNESIDTIWSFLDRGMRKLLVVEDNEAQRLSIEELVRGEDIDLKLVGTGADALQALEKEEFDCAVVDLGLPDMQGIELIQKIRSELGYMNLPIVVYTAKDLDENEVVQLNRLAEAVIVKGVESLDRLLDETALYLHRVEKNLPLDKQKRLQDMHQPETTLAGKKVLIVDDDIRNIFALSSLLERHKMEVVYAENGKDGIEMLASSDDVDAVLMDVMMPGMDGYEATRRIRKMPRFRTIPIIAVTAKAMKGDREKCIEAGASDYITKPVNVEQLISLLRVWIHK